MILICSILLIVSSIHAYPVGIEEWGHQGIGNTYQQVVYVETLPQEPLEYILSFPEADDPPLRINGIVHMEFNNAAPSNVSFIEGGIGESFVKINITAPPGRYIMSSFLFHCTIVETASNGEHNVEHFFETNVNIDLE